MQGNINQLQCIFFTIDRLQFIEGLTVMTCKKEKSGWFYRTSKLSVLITRIMRITEFKIILFLSLFYLPKISHQMNRCLYRSFILSGCWTIRQN